MRSTDPLDSFNLPRFVQAQDPVFERVQEELRAGQKRRHWMWFIFPQIAGLGGSEMSRHFAISCAEEAAAYLKEFPVQKAVAPRFWSQGKIAFSQRYLPQCYKDAGQRLANLGWHRNAQLEKTRQQAE